MSFTRRLAAAITEVPYSGRDRALGAKCLLIPKHLNAVYHEKEALGANAQFDKPRPSVYPSPSLAAYLIGVVPLQFVVLHCHSTKIRAQLLRHLLPNFHQATGYGHGLDGLLILNWFPVNTGTNTNKGFYILNYGGVL